MVHFPGAHQHKFTYKKIKKLQNKAVRIINFKKKEDPTPPLYILNGILPIQFNYKFLQGKFIWKLTHSQQPNRISGIFYSHGAILSDREIDIQFFKYRIPNQRTSYGINFLIYSGLKTWNQVIPNSITEIPTIRKFNRHLKCHFLNSITT